MSHTLAVRPFSALALILAGSALLVAPALASEEEAQAQEQIEQAEPAEAEEQQTQDETDDANEADADGASGEEAVDAHAADHDHVQEPDEHADNEAVQAYREVNRRMHEDMAIDFTGNPDADFSRSMIPHHQGAIDMANVVLMHGEDEAIRDLAREVIEAQEEEIAFLRDWLAQHGHEVE
ncbi:DUF305 domain-containing protein [Halomonas sp. A29]|uniref:CopM family metallochaperone n=1 Tax=Halomonas sp. A29 TaxID=3102786 RepID=UPI00398A7739